MRSSANLSSPKGQNTQAYSALGSYGAAEFNDAAPGSQQALGPRREVAARDPGQKSPRLWQTGAQVKVRGVRVPRRDSSGSQKVVGASRQRAAPRSQSVGAAHAEPSSGKGQLGPLLAGIGRPSTSDTPHTCQAARAGSKASSVYLAHMKCNLTLRSTGTATAGAKRPAISFWAFCHLPLRSG